MKQPLLTFLLLSLTLPILAQAPTGTISGSVQDESGAQVPGAEITITSKATGASRTLKSGADGIFSAPSLNAGVYTVKASQAGFRTTVRDATVETGAITTVEMRMQVGPSSESVTVEAATSQMEYERDTIDGVVTRQQIANLPLNGRNFLQLAELQPGVKVSPAGLGEFNKQFDVNVLGAGPESVLITVDGATINDTVTSGTQQNFSQEIVQEFQVSEANFDLSTGRTGGGAINVITRGGSNDFHGAGYFYFRDHNLAAYPYLQRDPLHPDPFFARRQGGFWLGGPPSRIVCFSSRITSIRIRSAAIQRRQARPNLRHSPPMRMPRTRPISWASAWITVPVISTRCFCATATMATTASRPAPVPRCRSHRTGRRTGITRIPVSSPSSVP